MLHYEAYRIGVLDGLENPSNTHLLKQSSAAGWLGKQAIRGAKALGSYVKAHPINTAMNVGFAGLTANDYAQGNISAGEALAGTFAAPFVMGGVSKGIDKVLPSTAKKWTKTFTNPRSYLRGGLGLANAIGSYSATAALGNAIIPHKRKVKEQEASIPQTISQSQMGRVNQNNQQSIPTYRPPHAMMYNNYGRN